jgi:hypothetical protein
VVAFRVREFEPVPAPDVEPTAVAATGPPLSELESCILASVPWVNRGEGEDARV